ncbi:MAG TPA: Na+/H+ antiporter [Methylocella sp.]|nr:Na+/H+ antiporter [Methylocella sp.]
MLAVVAFVAILADRLKIPSSILLVLAGIGLALIPGLPSLELAPDLVLLLVLPPVVYASSVAMSWLEFRATLTPIIMQAVGCVIFTTAAVAAAAHYLFDFTWSVGFVLGAIVSPPDVMAPLSIARRMQLPRRILVVLEGEGLANDATALILYRFAIVAVSSGVFSYERAIATFSAIVIGEIVWGIGVGWLTLHLRRWAKDPRVEITISILVPYLAYWPPQHLGGSGVLATVTTGLYISWNGLRLISAATRLQGIFFWDLFIYIVEGLVFLITGLQARTLLSRIGNHALTELVTSGLIVCGVVIMARFIWTLPAAYLPRWLIPAIRGRNPAPPWRWPLAVAFTGIRGIVSLAAALAIPLTTAGGSPFPDRDFILSLTFSVIIVTLVGQGLALPSFIRLLGLAHAGRLERRADNIVEYKARLSGVMAVLERLEELMSERRLAEEIIQPLCDRHADRLKHIEHRIDGHDGHRELSELHDELELLLIAAERTHINECYRKGGLKDEARRRIERELDLREVALARRETDE